MAGGVPRLTTGLPPDKAVAYDLRMIHQPRFFASLPSFFTARAASLTHNVSLACLALVLAACGNDGPSGTNAMTKEDRTRAALESLFASVRAGDVNAAAARIVYRGKDKDRKWKSVYDADKDDALDIKRAMEDIRRKLGDGEPEFIEFRSERESEGEWLVWKVKTEKGEAWFACLDIDGTIALGDID